MADNLRSSSPEGDSANKMRSSSPEGGSANKMRSSRPEGGSADKICSSSPEGGSADKMRSSSPEGDSANKLVMMANQIGAFFASQGPDQAAAGTASHLKKYWDPRMRAAIVAYLRAGGEGLRPEVRLAIEELARDLGEPAKVNAPG